jgi:hypothetical protein
MLSLREILMMRFVQGLDRTQSILFPAQLDDYIAEDNPVGCHTFPHQDDA